MTASAFIGAFTALCVTSSAAASISITDDLGRRVELKEPARRIVALAPFLTELVYTAGAGERIVGVSAYSDYPPEAAKLPQVSSAAGFSIEAIAALQPDLVLAWRDSARPEEVERLERLGAAVFVANARELDDVPRVLRAIGALVARDVAPLVARYEGRLGELRRAHAGERPLTALLEIWNRPLTTIAGRHFMNEALRICGARNVFEDLPGVAPVVSLEEVYRRDPQLIVGASSAKQEDDFRAQWREHPALAAVKSGRIVFVDADRIQRLTARTPEGIAELCRSIDRVR
ncbi:MAG: cobalamin-binding protein [Usitatibacter sp.]